MLKNILTAALLASLFTAQAEEPESQTLENDYRAEKLKVARELMSRSPQSITDTEVFRRANPQIKRGMEALRKKTETGWSFLWNDSQTKIEFLQGKIPLANSSKISDRAEKIATNFLKENHELFQLRSYLEDLPIESVNEEGRNNYVVRFKQTFNGLPVLNGSVKISINEKKEIYMLHNYYVPNITLSTIPRLSEKDVIVIAKNHMQQNYMYTVSLAGRLPYSGEVIYFSNRPPPLPKLAVFDFHETPILVYEFYLDIQKPRVDLHYIVDANTGEIIESQNTIVYN